MAEATAPTRVVIADDDVRYDRAALEHAARLLDHSEVVRPQNVFTEWPWHAIWDTGRTLLARVSGGEAHSALSGGIAQLAEDEALLPPVVRDLDIARHQMALLVGKSPAEWTAPDFDLAKLQGPAEIPVSLIESDQEFDIIYAFFSKILISESRLTFGFRRPPRRNLLKEVSTPKILEIEKRIK